LLRSSDIIDDGDGDKDEEVAADNGPSLSSRRFIVFYTSETTPKSTTNTVDDGPERSYAAG
jgi:hypothetical protein